jgi:epoxyqueuosine reductase
VDLTERLKAAARDLGFGLVGVCPAVAPSGITRFREWLAAGYAGEMKYLTERADAYGHPSSVLEGVRSILMLGMHYSIKAAGKPRNGYGLVSRYAWGNEDYHDVIHLRLKQLCGNLREWAPSSVARGVVDTAPLLEREFAQLAGLGWIGKNTLLLNRDSGSYFFLAALLTDVELNIDAPHESDHCGTCTACLDACPTDAFPAPYQLDATRCLSYLTIELRSAIPIDLRPGIGDWLFGCDICQDVCPWNGRAPGTTEDSFQPRADSNPMDLTALFLLNDEQFRERFRRTPLWRSKRRGILRNAAIVLGNQAQPSSHDALATGLADTEPLVRAASAWALGQLATPRARTTLQRQLEIESDESVRKELARIIHEDRSESS